MSSFLGYLFYQIFFAVFILIITPFLLPLLMIRKYRLFILQKFGFSLPVLPGDKTRKRIWINAVSIGELRAITPLIRDLRSRAAEAAIFLSIGTLAGMRFSRNLDLPVDIKFYYPLDLPWVVRHVLKNVKPDIYITAEAELWPNFIS